MKVFGLAGWSGSGKTTLIVRIVPLIVARGISVSTVKHAHHNFDVDKPGKDSFKHRDAGATEVLVTSANRWALMHELRGTPEPTLDDLLSRMSEVDLVIVEGFKHFPHDKIEVFARATGQPLLAPSDPNVVAIAADSPVPETKLPVFDREDGDTIVDFILTHTELDAVKGAA